MFSTLLPRCVTHNRVSFNPYHKATTRWHIYLKLATALTIPLDGHYNMLIPSGIVAVDIHLYIFGENSVGVNLKLHPTRLIAI